MAGTRRVAIVAMVAMAGGLVSAAVPASPAAAVVVLDGTPNGNFIPGGSQPFGVAVVSVDSAHVYWGNASTDMIGRANLNGTGVNQSFINARVGCCQEATNGVAVRGNRLWWSNQFTGTIGRATLNGSGAATGQNNAFITGGNQTTRVVVTATNIYWANNGNDTIGRAGLDANGDLVPMSVNQSFITTGPLGDGPVGLAVDANYVYWANQNSSTIGRANINGSGINNSFITSGVNLPAGVAVDARHIYWANYSLGTISVADIDGTDVQVLIGNTYTSSPRGVALDSNYIYWTNNSSGSIGRAALLDVPGPPTGVSAVAGNASGSVSYTAPTDPGGSAITSYTVTCTSTTLGANSPVSTAPSLANPTLVSGLTNGATYTCTVTATNADGAGAPSAPSNSFVPTATVPDAPTIGVATPGNGTGSVAFTPPASDGGSPITGYTLTCNPGGIQVPGSGSPIAIGSLTNGTTYICSVTATNAAGTGPPSGTVSFIPRTVPGAPTIGVATPGNGTGSVAFTPPASDGGSPITGYTLTCNPGGIQVPGSGSPIAIGSLTNGTTYTCSVTATNAAGTGPPSGTVSFIPRTVPGAPTIGVATPGNGTGSVAFTPPASDGGSPITGYTLTCNPGGIQVPGSGSPIAIGSLTNGTTYTCSVTATNAAGTGPPSGTVSFIPRTVPGAPTIGLATGGNTAGSVTFTPPTSNGGSAITIYTMTCTSSNGGTTRQATGTIGPIVVTALDNGFTYTCSVTATNAAGTGPPSAQSNAFVPAGIPGAPTINSVTAIVDPATQSVTSASVSFTPGPSNGSAITSYTVTCVSLAGGPTVTASGTGSPIVVSGLSGGQNVAPYQCTVTATNGVGTSLPSAPSSIFFVGRSGPGNCTALPTAPGSPSTAPGNGYATVSWAPSSGCVAGYVVTPYLGSVPLPSFLIPGPGTSTKIQGLTNGQSYRFTISAENGSALGPASAYTGTVTAGAPSASTALKVTRVGRGALKVTFAVAANNGAAITSYTATCKSSNRGVTRTKSGKKGPLIVTGLSPGKSYSCSVRATNNRGTGPSSKPSKAMKA